MSVGMNVKGTHEGMWRTVAGPLLRQKCMLLLPLMLLGLFACSGLCGPRLTGGPLLVGLTLAVPQWSLDGDRIMFEGMTVDGVNRPEGQRLDWISLRVARPDLSPDGTRVVYGRDPEEKSYSKVIESSKLDGSDRKRLFDEDKLYAYSPAWSPDGARIAFVWYTGIYTMAADGSDVRLIVPLTEPGYYWNEYDLPYAGPVWSPDGKALAYVVWEPAPDIPPPVKYPRRYSLYVAAADGSGSARVFAATGHGTIELDSIGWPSWSPDGERLAFMRHVRGDYDSGRYAVGEEIGAPLGFTPYTIRRDGSDLREVAPGIPRVGWNKNLVLFPNASWSPDGTEILFNLGNGYIYVAQADGGGYRQVGEGTYASWSPDGSRIAVADPRGDRSVKYIRAGGEVSSNGVGLGGKERVRDPATSWRLDYLWSMAPDGSDRRVLVGRTAQGALVAANLAPPKPKPWYRFW